jgi:hypothetical protein
MYSILYLQARIQGRASDAPLICKKIFEIGRKMFKIGKSLKLTVNFNVKRPVPPLSPDPGSAPDFCILFSFYRVNFATTPTLANYNYILSKILNRKYDFSRFSFSIIYLPTPLVA